MTTKTGTRDNNSSSKKSYFSLAWASEGAPVPFPLAYIALEAGLFGDAEDSNVMDVLDGTESNQRASASAQSANLVG